MPLHGGQVGEKLNFGELKEIRFADGATGAVGCGLYVRASRVVVTEIGVNAGTLSGTSPTIDLQVRRRSSTIDGSPDGIAVGWTTVASTPTSHQLSATGVSVYRPTGGVVEITASMKDPIDTTEDLIQFQVRAVEGGTWTDWTGSLWMKYIKLD